jgi:hypothetical protein
MCRRASNTAGKFQFGWVCRGNKKFPAKLRGILLSVSEIDLEPFYQQAQNKQGKPGKNKPKGIAGKRTNNANAAKKTKQAKYNRNPERSAFRGGQFHLILL